MTIKIIDTHQHLWDLQKIRLPWVDNIPQLNRSFDCEDYYQYTNHNSEADFDYEIEQSLYMEVDVDEEDIETEIQIITQLCDSDSNRLTGIIASGRPESDLFADSVKKAKNQQWIKGFRRVLHTESTPPETCLSEQFQDSMRLLGSNGYPFDLCMRADDLLHASSLAENCPDTQFVVDHCGNPDVRMTSEQISNWANAIQVLAGNQNVACKISGFVWTMQSADWNYEKDIEPILRRVYEAFGPDRLLFGGDWPVCTLSALSFQQWLNAIYRFSTETDSRLPEKLFYRNAKAIYGI